MKESLTTVEFRARLSNAWVAYKHKRFWGIVDEHPLGFYEAIGDLMAVNNKEKHARKRVRN